MIGDPVLLDACGIAEATTSGAVTAEQVATAFLDRIAARDAAVQAWAWLDREAAIAAARALDANGPRGPLFGVPIGVKDVFQTRDMPTSHGSPIYADHRPGIDAACVDTLRAAGALILGKTTTVEFAGFGRKTPTRHPLDPTRSPGGTSSGSAAAVADGQVPLALGTQTAGSTIRPASFCGVHAIKPTWSVVSREGVKLFAVSLDTVTWFGGSLRDLDLLCEIFGIEDAEVFVPKAIHEMRIAVCRTAAWDSALPCVRDGLATVEATLAAAGAELVELELPPHFAELRRAHIDVMLGEGRAGLLNEHRAHPDLLDPDYASMIEGERKIASSRLRTALDMGASCRVEWDRLAAAYDAVLTPSAADEAPIGLANTGDAAFNQMWSLLHAPCINLPVLRGPSGLPIGLTVTGPRFADRQLLVRARAIEQALPPIGGRRFIPEQEVMKIAVRTTG